MFPKRNLFAAVFILILGLSPFAYADDATIPSASPITTATTEATPVAISLSGTSNDGGAISYATTTSPGSGTLDTISGSSVTYTPNAGFTGTDSFQYVVTEGATSSAPASVSIIVSAPAITTGTAHITVRDGATVATSSDVSFPLSGNSSLTTTLGSSHDVAASSTLAALASFDTSAPEFSISDLQYNAGFSSFYLRCITLSGGSPDCDNWQYTVNGVSPGVGMDKYVLHDGDMVYVYFGSPRIVSLSSSSVTAGTPVTATAEQYDPVAGVYNPITGYTIGATQPNPADPWNPLEIATSTADANGQALFTLNATGTYQVGLKEDFYFPTTDLTVTDPVPSSPSGSGGGSTGGANTTPTFSIASALSFVTTHQNPDGSFSSSLITDWTAVAFAAANPGTGKQTLKNYLATQNVPLSGVLDYERHAMALEALGIDPYSGSPINTIAPIVSAFDGTQVGSSGLVNDDIFALIPLLHAGYTQSDSMIQKIATFVISKQKPDGSWEESPDLTGAAIQALGPLYTVSGYGQSLGMAAGYLASTQQPDGGWSSVDSTSWVLTAINAVNESDPAHASSWVSSGNHVPLDSLANAQQGDGGVSSSGDRTWSTSYAIVGASGKSWLSLLQNFSKPAPAAQGGSTVSGGANAFSGAASTTSATSTAAAATSTPAVASTTPAILATSTPETVATSTPTATSTPPAPKKKKIAAAAPAPLPAPEASQQEPSPAPAPESQTAAAGNTGGGFLAHVWGWISGFFSRVF